ncbi:MAG: EipA family protein [Steroidobacteraceae bacterium]|jgi:hypothetical protein
MRRALLVLTMMGIGSMSMSLTAIAANNGTAATPASTYSDDEIVKQANDFFANGAKGLSDVLAKVLKEKGQPVAFIRGEEAGGAVAVGVRYGHGELVFKDGRHRIVYWQGPSLGFDIGADAVKAFVLVYNLPNAEALYQRFPSVEGSLYFVGGFGVNYVQAEGIALAPVRFGVGWRQGIDVGYMHFSPEKRVNPF